MKVSVGKSYITRGGLHVYIVKRIHGLQKFCLKGQFTAIGLHGVLVDSATWAEDGRFSSMEMDPADIIYEVGTANRDPSQPDLFEAQEPAKTPLAKVGDMFRVRRTQSVVTHLHGKTLTAKKVEQYTLDQPWCWVSGEIDGRSIMMVYPDELERIFI